MNHEQVRARAKRRLEGIELASARINIKLKDLPKDSRVPAWIQRLKEYAVSIPSLQIELKTGKRCLIKDETQQALIAELKNGHAAILKDAGLLPSVTDGVVVSPPTANPVNMEGAE